MADVSGRFGANLACRRGDLGGSLEAIAELAGLAPAEVAAFEHGEAGLPDVDALIRLATALEIAPEGLIAGIDWTPGEGGPGAFRVDQRSA